MAKTDKENVEQIDGEIVLSIEKLQKIQDDLEKINEKASDEQKYNEIRKSLYEKRNEIIKTIPNFWLIAFLNHPGLTELVTVKDQKILDYLSSLDVEDAKDDVKSGYSVNFYFNPNPFFEDEKLTKTFTVLEDGTTKVSVMPIKWKEGKDPNGVNQEKKGNKRLSALFPEDSFFTFFTDAQYEDEDDMEVPDELVGELIKGELWTNPIPSFKFWMEGEDDEEEDEDETDEDDEEEDEGEEEEDRMVE